MVETLNLWAGKWLEAIWKVTWQSGILVVVIFFVTNVFRKRLTPTIRHLLWTLVVAKLLITPFVSVPVTIPVKAQPVPAPVLQETMPIALPAETKAISQPFPTTTEVKTAPVPLPEPPSPKATLYLSFLLFSLWLSGVVIFLLGITIRSIRLCRQLSPAESLEDKDILTSIDRGAKELKIRPPKLKVSDRFTSPLVCGIFRPVLIIPRQILEKFQPKELESIILHELAHLKRRDILTNYLQILAQAFYFFNPLVWYVNRQIRLEREQACDDWVLQLNQGERKDYADALLKVIKLGSRSKYFALSIVGLSEPFTSMSRRLKMVMDKGRKISTRISLKTFLIMVMVGLVVIPAYAITKKPMKGNLLALQENTSVVKDVVKVDSALVQMDNSSSIAFTITREWEKYLLTEVWVVQPDEKAPKLIKTYLGFTNVSWQPRNGEFLVDNESILRAHFGNKPYGGAGNPIITGKSLFLKGDGLERTMTFPAEFSPLYSELSPEGKSLVVCGYRKLPGGSFEGGIWILDLVSGNLKKMFDGAIKTLPRWSPDSKSVLVADGQDYTNKYRLKLIDARTGQITDTGVDGVGPDWSPDGSRIAYSGDIIQGGSWYRGIPIDGSIFTYDVKTRETKRLTEKAVNIYDKDTKEWKLSGSLLPKWSPDGKKILYSYRNFDQAGSREYKQNITELWVMGADGSNKKKLISEPNGYPTTEYVWTDANYVLAKTKDALWKIDVETGAKEKILDLTEENAKLNQREENGLRKAVSLIGEGIGFYVNGEESRGKGELADAQNFYAKAIENFNNVVKECPGAKVSVQNLPDYVEKFRKLKDATPEEEATEVCENHMYFMMSLLEMFRREYEGTYPKNLAVLLNWSLQNSWQINEIRSTDTEKIKLMFHCIAEPGNDINYAYTRISLDAPDGTPVIVCERHSGEVIMVVKDARELKVIKKSKRGAK